jgi:hypothetical protein
MAWPYFVPHNVPGRRRPLRSSDKVFGAMWWVKELQPPISHRHRRFHRLSPVRSRPMNLASDPALPVRTLAASTPSIPNSHIRNIDRQPGSSQVELCCQKFNWPTSRFVPSAHISNSRNLTGKEYQHEEEIKLLGADAEATFRRRRLQPLRADANSNKSMQCFFCMTEPYATGQI